MPQFRFSIRTLLVIIAVVAIYFPYEQWRRQHLRASYNIFYISENLIAISEGDSVESVSARFTTFIEVEPKPVLVQNLGLIEFGPEDTLYRYPFDSTYYGFLHFRDGKLASYQKPFHTDPVAMTQATGGKIPTEAERMSSLSIYLMFVFAIFVTYFILLKLVHAFRSETYGSASSMPQDGTNVG